MKDWGNGWFCFNQEKIRTHAQRERQTDRQTDRQTERDFLNAVKCIKRNEITFVTTNVFILFC